MLEAFQGFAASYGGKKTSFVEGLGFTGHYGDGAILNPFLRDRFASVRYLRNNDLGSIATTIAHHHKSVFDWVAVVVFARPHGFEPVLFV